MNGYTPIPHNIFLEDIKIIKKYRDKGKLSPAYIILYVLNVKKMQWETSYAQLSKITGWHRRDIKNFLNHIGADITTQKNSNKKGIITSIQPVKSSFKECYFNAINNIEKLQKKGDNFGQEDGQEMDRYLDREKQVKSDSFDNFGQEDGQEMDKYLDNNNKRIKIEDNKRVNIYSQAAKIIIGYLNQKSGKNFKPKSKAAIKHIQARMKEGYSIEDFKKVIDTKVPQWLGTEYDKYIRPETLFNLKFEGYLNERPIKKITAYENKGYTL